ncbi:hypothetical protein SAMN05518672_1011218 [Chitinophaga sp. CF118]|uniref:hypothetical protein n=1 Tax=Chitinophaga sp. CF118 TaxID=1884367 RepID=UPI0008F00A25|nr:hypothetical protein [Chitinophaga sp. CF118]SFD24232.1 hypothetical protein SAMN05518672_1011218 [Chitinophaga sp. CF118]
MPNPKRRAAIRNQSFNSKKVKVAIPVHGGRKYATLSEVEDRNDRSFLANIAKNAAVNAINENKAMNIPVTVTEDGWIVKKYVDGTVIRVAPIERRVAVQRRILLTKGTVLHVKPR